MRLWLTESERRPDPAPIRTDARKALFAGTVAWIVALVVAILARDWLESIGTGWFVAAAAIGVVLGAAGLVVVQLRRGRRGSAD
ncbi:MULTISPECIES: DUF2530 domain-containing protein [unclassified Agromyces]|uniref:DUF2530 domain-containing protein n=1 Tax=unclassified Agromyces TaxID=2639701 RepID=UPI00301568E5